jgi:hypothetical protein
MNFVGRMNRKAVVAAFLANLLVFSTALFPQIPNKQTAILVEAYGLPTCAGFDCPPWHVAQDFEVCLKAGEKFYLGSYSADKGPWAKKLDLREFEGQAVEIQVGDKIIRMVSPHFKIKLKRTYGAEPSFRTESCKNAHAS